MKAQPQITLCIHAELQKRASPNSYEVFVMAGKKCLQQWSVRSREEAQEWLAEHWGLSL